MSRLSLSLYEQIRLADAEIPVFPDRDWSLLVPPRPKSTRKPTDKPRVAPAVTPHIAAHDYADAINKELEGS